MRKLIAGINMTLDGYCDHTAGIANEETHQHYNDLLKAADTIIWGRITYQLMEDYWPTLIDNPSGNKQIDDFAVLANDIQKIVYSRTLNSVNWKNAELKHELIKEEIEQLKQQPGKDILVGSPSLIVAFSNLGLVDEYQLAIHPVIAGSGLTLFKNITDKIDLELLKTKTLDCGVVIHYYHPTNR